MKEYSLDLKYIKGENNIVTDALIRLVMNDKPFYTRHSLPRKYALTGTVMPKRK